MKRLALLVLIPFIGGCTAVGSVLDGMAGYQAIPPTDDPRWFMLGSLILPVLKDLIQMVIQLAPLLM